jgi:hypothetical protein
MKRRVEKKIAVNTMKFPRFRYFIAEIVNRL